jgi:hypothetical protein
MHGPTSFPPNPIHCMPNRCMRQAYDSLPCCQCQSANCRDTVSPYYSERQHPKSNIHTNHIIRRAHYHLSQAKLAKPCCPTRPTNHQAATATPPVTHHLCQTIHCTTQLAVHFTCSSQATKCATACMHGHLQWTHTGNVCIATSAAFALHLQLTGRQTRHNPQ